LTLTLQTRARQIAERYRLAFYDALIVASARNAGCTLLLTEDLQAEAVIDGVRIRNPFSPVPNLGAGLAAPRLPF
jgi:predicted nucleic acid-binding protein